MSLDRADTGTFAGAACLCLLLGGIGCTALIDQELSQKTSSTGAGAAGAAGAGGAAGAAGAGGAGAGGATLTTSSTSVIGCPGGCSLPHATAVCVVSDCAIADCDPGFADCDGAPHDGCEADLLHDDDHCGACDKDCGGPKSCEHGKCK